jgi:ribonucleoside-diphosphate reductase alpha chain
LTPFVTPIQALQFADKYARWNPQERRRETWEEAVKRVMNFFFEGTKGAGQEGWNSPLTFDEWDELWKGMLNMEALPSMRILQMAGPALERCNVGAYNCAYLPIDSFQSFGDLLYILMQGTGCGFSVEASYVDKLPRIKKQGRGPWAQHIIPDTTEGWCNALVYGLGVWSRGGDVEFDYSLIRPQGAVLKTKGGRASGPDPLRQLLGFARARTLAKQGGRLTTLDCHDIACYCGQIVQVGGVRRAAEISLSDFDDRDMREAKSGQFWESNPQRAMANNSVVYEEPPSAVEFMEEWLSLAKSGTGERGIFNRQGMVATSPKRRKGVDFGTNPCGEIALRPRQFCNLSIAVARPGDSWEDLKRKVRLAAIFGTLQSTLTTFKYLDERWKANCEDERLLGVDITGQMDCEILRPLNDDPIEMAREWELEGLRETVVATNREYAGRLGVGPSAATTCVKPSGNSAQLFNCSSGLHPRYAAYYIRRLRIGAYTPVAKLLIASGVPFEPEVGQTRETASVLVFEYPVASPPGALTRHDLSALQQLENWLAWKRHYTEHNPSVTIYVEPDEWPQVGAWVWTHFNEIGGLSFLPKDGGIYALAPYEEITKEEYERRMGAFPDVDFGRLSAFEIEDSTEVNREFACTGDKCEL